MYTLVIINGKKPKRNKQTKAEKSSPKCRSSLDKDSLRKPEAKSAEKEDHQKSYNEMNERELYIFESISSDEEQCSPEQPSSRNSKPVTITTENEAPLSLITLSVATKKELKYTQQRRLTI